MTRVAVLGGGQLGRMLGLAGIPLGCTFTFLDPVAGAPAAAVGDLVVGGLDDVDAARLAAKGADVVTYEWEGVPAATARALEASAAVLPPPRALDVSQDRLLEKETLNSLGIGTAPFRAVDSLDDLRAAVDALGLPSVLKTRRGGYDGKGQSVLRSAGDVETAWGALGSVPLILEGFVPFARELSILAVRSLDGEVRCWPAVENMHRDGILRVTRVPAIDASQADAEACIRPLLDELQFVGVCCVELFDVDGTLLANEIAPRVHNSGHWTIEGAVTSQFEQHIRAICDLPPGVTGLMRGGAVMENLIGPDVERWPELVAERGAHVHIYGKGEARPGRKMGHVTRVKR
jgi:5-(carboxyamino)imidazole ribonucleotide synthase